METKQQLLRDAALARRLAERASDAIARELLEIAEQLEKVVENEMTTDRPGTMPVVVL